MKALRNKYISELDREFDSSWKKLALITENSEDDKMQKSIKRMHTNLKWSIAYAFLQNYCGEIIKPYSQYSSMIIKKFWIDYIEQFFMTNLPPTPQSFFEWYCDSKTIMEESCLLHAISVPKS